MALNDRFNRSGDTWLTRFDAYLTYQAYRVGEWWATHTAWDRHTLTQGILALSGFAALERVVLLHDMLYLLVAFAILSLSYTKPAK